MAAPKKATQSAPAKKGEGLRVTAPLVQVRVGSQVLHLFNGDIVPDGIAKEQLDHLSELGYVTKGDGPTPDDN